MGNIQFANVALDCFSVTVVLLLTVCTVIRDYKKDRLSRVYVLLCVVAITMMLSDAAGWIFDGTDNPLYSLILHIADFWVFISGFICLAVFTFYIYVRMSKYRKISKSYPIFACVIFSLGLILTVISCFNGMFFYYDENGIYNRGSFYYISQILLLTFVIGNTVIAINRKNGIRTKEIISIMIYVWIPVLAAVIQSFSYGISLICPSGCLSILLIYINIQSEEMVYMRQLSEYDALTDLYNRTKYEDNLKYTYAHLHSCGVIWFDINNLKEVNDRFGHEAGDSLLTQLADSIRSITSRNIHGYRMGGDEFLVVVCNCAEYELKTLTELWSARLAYINKISDHACSVAYGTAWAQGEFLFEELIHKADNEMYVNKKNYKMSLSKE